MSQALENQKTLKGEKFESMRDIECALFMMGYDFPALRANKNKAELLAMKCLRSLGFNVGSQYFNFTTPVLHFGQ